MTQRYGKILCSWTGRTNTVKIIILPKATTDSVNPNINGIFHRTRTIFFNIVETQKTLNRQSNLEKDK